MATASAVHSVLTDSIGPAIGWATVRNTSRRRVCIRMSLNPTTDMGLLL